MNDNLRAQIRANLDQKETAELVEIWQKHNLNEWTELTFDIVQEILQERQVVLPQQGVPSTQKFDSEIDKITDLGELEQKIKESERLLLQAKSNRMSGFIPLIGSIGIVIASGLKIPSGGLIYLLITVIGLLYLCFNVWRLYSADNKIRQSESKLKEYQDKKAELHSQPPIKE